MYLRLIPVTTGRLSPPKDDLWNLLESSLPELQEGDILAVSSKVIAVDQGACVIRESASLREVALREADRYIDVHPEFLLGEKYDALLPNAGVDESNGCGYYVLLPRDLPIVAQKLRDRLVAHFGMKRLGLIVTDSGTVPLRKGLVGISLASCGVRTLIDYRGAKDLFGRELLYTRANVVDSLASAATLMMGEGDESRPFVLIRGTSFAVPDSEAGENIRADSSEDLFTPLLQGLISRTSDSEES